MVFDGRATVINIQFFIEKGYDLATVLDYIQDSKSKEEFCNMIGVHGEVHWEVSREEIATKINEMRQNEDELTEEDIAELMGVTNYSFSVGCRRKKSFEAERISDDQEAFDG